jgi:selenium metabolism protein YedF
MDVANTAKGTVVIINGESMGRGSDELGKRLVGNFLRTLAGLEAKPDAIIFYNAGVRLLAKDSPCLDGLKALDDAGVDLLACVTCLDFYGLQDKLALGQVSNMREIAQRLMTAGKVITV